MTYEVEYKFEINKDISEKIINNFKNNLPQTIIEQIDTYYDFKEKALLRNADKALRIRKSFKNIKDELTIPEVEITFKEPKFRKNSKTRNEINLTIQDYNGFHTLFSELTLLPIKTIKKSRMTYKDYLDDKNMEINVSLDTIEDLGYFIELESFTKEINKISKIEEKILSYWTRKLKGFNVKDQKPYLSIRESYLELLSKKEK